MISEDQLREKLRKIEALYAGAKTDGEKSAAGAAAERIRVKFENASKQERAEEFKFSITDPWSRQLFIALCRRYGIKPFRYTRMHRQTVIIRAPASFVQMTLWPEFEELSSALTAHQIGRAHVWTPVTNAHSVCRLLLEKKNVISAYLLLTYTETHYY